MLDLINLLKQRNFRNFCGLGLQPLTDIDNLRYAVYLQGDNHTEHRTMNVSALRRYKGRCHSSDSLFLSKSNSPATKSTTSRKFWPVCALVVVLPHYRQVLRGLLQLTVPIRKV